MLHTYIQKGITWFESQYNQELVGSRQQVAALSPHQKENKDETTSYDLRANEAHERERDRRDDEMNEQRWYPLCSC